MLNTFCLLYCNSSQVQRLNVPEWTKMEFHCVRGAVLEVRCRHSNVMAQGWVVFFCADLTQCSEKLSCKKIDPNYKNKIACHVTKHQSLWLPITRYFSWFPHSVSGCWYYGERHQVYLSLVARCTSMHIFWLILIDDLKQCFGVHILSPFLLPARSRISLRDAVAMLATTSRLASR